MDILTVADDIYTYAERNLRNYTRPKDWQKRAVKTFTKNGKTKLLQNVDTGEVRAEHNWPLGALNLVEVKLVKTGWRLK